MRVFNSSWAIPDEDAEYILEQRYPGIIERQEEMRKLARDGLKHSSNEQKDNRSA